MLQKLGLVFTIGFLVLSVGCGSKKKAEDSVAAGDVSADGSIGARDMSFDGLGSDSGKIQGLSTINFDYDQAALSSQSRKTLAENADWIRQNAGVTVQIEGHCDSRGSVEYNLALGERRATSVKNYLVSLGVDPKRLTIISFGKEKPISNAESEEAYAQNRRANFVPLPN